MVEEIQLIYKASDIETSNITFRLISEAGKTDTNVEETQELNLYIKNEYVTV